MAAVATPDMIEVKAGTDHLWDALHDVEDPEFPMSVVDMGLVRDIEKTGSHAHVKMTFTAMGCPCIDMIMEDVEARLLEEADIDSAEIEIVWFPVWTKNSLTERGKEIMMLNGVTL